MEYTVRLFGPFAGAAQRDELTVRLDAVFATVADLRKGLADLEPALVPLLHVSRFAVNDEFAREDQRLQPGDEIAVIGLVSGG